MNFGKVKKIAFDYVALTVAAVIFAFAWEVFMIPNGMSAGGLMGLCTVIQFATQGALQASWLYMGINAALIIIAVLAMGLAFGFRTIYCIALSSLAMELVGGIEAIHAVPGGFFYIRETALIPIVAGAFEAVGLGLILRFGGSTGGTDILAVMINKYWPVSLSKVFLVTDMMVIFLILFLPDKTFSDMIYGFEEIITFTLMVDTVVGGQKSSYQIMVFSDKFNQIADYIINEMERGVTVLRAQGWYTKNDKNVLLIIINRKEFPNLSKVIKDIDPRAFMSVSQANNVYGEGFEEIKSGVKLLKKKKNENQ